MYSRTQIWTAKVVPFTIPNFVNPHITVETNIYTKVNHIVFECLPYGALFRLCKTPHNKVKTILRQYGFKSPRKIYDGLRSEIFLDGVKYPPAWFTDVYGEKYDVWDMEYNTR